MGHLNQQAVINATSTKETVMTGNTAVASQTGIDSTLKRTTLKIAVLNLDCTHKAESGESYISSLDDGGKQCSNCLKVFTNRGNHFVLMDGSNYSI